MLDKERTEVVQDTIFMRKEEKPEAKIYNKSGKGIDRLPINGRKDGESRKTDKRKNIYNKKFKK